jgi:large subunit ribosomal protein L30
MNLMEKKTTQKEPAKKAGKPGTENTEEKAIRKTAATKEKPVVTKTEERAPAAPAHKTPPKATAVEASPQPSTPEVPVEAPAEAKPAPARAVVKRPESARQLRLRWVRSAIGAPVKQKRIVHGLGFHRLHEIITRPDTPMIRGMVERIAHLVEIVE